MLYRKGDYKYQLAKIECFKDVGIYPEHDIVTPFIKLSVRGKLSIKEAYAWDGPSGPTIDTKTFMRGSLAHDALYQLMRHGYLSRKNRPASDLALRNICIEDGMWKIRAWWVYRGVKLGGNPSTDPKNAKKTLIAP